MTSAAVPGVSRGTFLRERARRAWDLCVLSAFPLYFALELWAVTHPDAPHATGLELVPVFDSVLRLRSRAALGPLQSAAHASAALLGLLAFFTLSWPELCGVPLETLRYEATLSLGRTFFGFPAVSVGAGALAASASLSGASLATNFIGDAQRETAHDLYWALITLLENAVIMSYAGGPLLPS